MQINIREFSFLNDLWDRIDIIEVEERKMKKLVLTMLSIAGMMLFTALPAKACTSYYVGRLYKRRNNDVWTNRGYFLP